LSRTLGYTISYKKISDCIDKKQTSQIVELSSQFYTLIPHVFGMRVPPPIKDPVMLKEKLAMVEALADIEVALKVLGTVGDAGNPIDQHYANLKADFQPLDKSGRD